MGDKLPEGVKYDGEKLRFDLIPAYPLETLADVYTRGAIKYEDRNWEKGMKWSRIFAAIMRHLWAFWRGEDIDKESGQPHVAHAAWGCFALLEYMRVKREFDDRPNKPTLKELFNELEKNHPELLNRGGVAYAGPHPNL